MNEQERKAMVDKMKADNTGGGDRKYWNIPGKEEGTFPIRILPPLKKIDEEVFYMKHQVHWIDGKPFECLNQSMNDKNGNFHEAENCPVCSFVSKLYKTATKDDDDWKLAGELRAKERNVSRIVVRGSETETTPVFYEYGPTIFKILFHIMTETDFGIIVDPKDGRDFMLTKVGTGRRSRYDTSTPSANSSPIFKEVEKLKEVFTKATEMNYQTLIEFTTLESIKNALNTYLGMNDEEVVRNEASKDRANIEYDTPDETSEEDEDIDDILSEFTS